MSGASGVNVTPAARPPLVWGAMDGEPWPMRLLPAPTRPAPDARAFGAEAVIR